MEMTTQVQNEEIDTLGPYHPRCLSAVPVDLEEILAAIKAEDK